MEFEKPVLPKNIAESPQTAAMPSNVHVPRPIDLTDSFPVTSGTSVLPISRYRKLPPDLPDAPISNLDEMKVRDEFDPEPFNRKYHPDISPRDDNPQEEGEIGMPYEM